MASQAIDANGDQRIIGDIIAVDAGDILSEGRLRAIDMPWATALGRVMLAEGQRTPIEVCRHRPDKLNALTRTVAKGWLLVSGGHRHAAATIFPELNPLKCIEVDAGLLDRRLAQVSENLWRKDLTPVERADFVAEMHDVLRTKAMLPPDTSPQKIAADARWKKELRKSAGDASLIVRDAYGFTDIIAEYLRLSRQTIERDLMLARRLSPTARQSIQHLSIYGNATQLRALARLERAQQEQVAAMLEAGDVKSVGEALGRLLGRPKPNEEDRRLSTFIGTYGRMPLSEKKGALAQLAGLLPSGWRLVEGAGE